MIESLWILCFEEGYEHEPFGLSSQATGNLMPSIGLPVMSDKALEALINGQSHTGGYVASFTPEPVDELRGHGLVGKRDGLTRRGAAFAHWLQCLYFEGDDECGKCRDAREYLKNPRKLNRGVA